LEWPRKIVSLLKANDICSISFIPDSVIGQILKEAEKDPFFHFTTLAREEEGIGIITGEFFLRLKLPMIHVMPWRGPREKRLPGRLSAVCLQRISRRMT
jgi:sulfopyruvate decarboxylase TPP-binding subunit